MTLISKLSNETKAGRRPVVSRLVLGAAATVALVASLTAPAPARAHGNVSEALSALSMLPVAVSVVAPSAVLAAGVVLTVVAIEATVAGTVWVLQRASDGVRISVRFAGRVVAGAATVVGATVSVIVVATGTILSAAGEAIAFIPNQIGASLLYNERVTIKDRVTR